MDSPSEVESSSQALTDTFTPGSEFARNWLLVPLNGAQIVHTLDPVVFTNMPGVFSVMSRDDQKKFRTYTYDAQVSSNAWGTYGASKTFASGPAVAMREQGLTGRGLIVAGKVSTDNRIYVSLGSMDPTRGDGTAVNPTFDTAFTPVDSDTSHAYTVNGSPTLASNDEGTALVFLGDDNKTIYAHYRPHGGNWSPRITGPKLTVTGSGKPGIAFLPGWVQLFQVVVLANGKLYETYFDKTRFCGVIPSMSAVWAQLPVTGTIDSSPSLTYSPQIETAVLYYRSGGSLVQTSGFATQQAFGTLPVRVVNSSASTTYAGAPGAAAGFQIEVGTNLVVGRTNTNVLYASESQRNEELIP